MSRNFRDFLQKILEVINYQDDKNAFIDHFLKNIHIQSIADLIKTLPEEKQTQIEQQLKETASNPETSKEILNQNFSEEEIQESLKKTTQEALTKYIEAVRPSLNEAQKAALLNIFQEIKAPASN